MSDKNVFLDTNVIVYALSDDDNKKKIAIDILKDRPFVSLQVLNELCNVCRKKLNLPYSKISEMLYYLVPQIRITYLHEATILRALDIGAKYGYSYYDSLIIASAIEAKCQVIYSEDFQHNQIIEEMTTVINPFRIG